MSPEFHFSDYFITIAIFFPPKCLFFNWLVNAQIERGHFPKVSPIRWLILIVSYCNPPHSCILFYLKKVKEVNIRVSLYYMVLHIPCKHIRYIHTKETILDYALYVSPNTTINFYVFNYILFSEISSEMRWVQLKIKYTYVHIYIYFF